MIHEQPIVKDLLQKLRELLFDFSVLGGYPRDLAHGKTPKDMDICIYNFHQLYPEESKFFGILLQWLGENNLIDEVHSTGSGDGDNRVMLVLKLTCDVDLIFWIGDTKWDVLNSFDFNINLYEFDLVKGEPKFLGQNEGTVVQIRQDFRSEDQFNKRVARVKEVAQEIGWCLDENNLTSLPTKM